MNAYQYNNIAYKNIHFIWHFNICSFKYAFINIFILLRENKILIIALNSVHINLFNWFLNEQNLIKIFCSQLWICDQSVSCLKVKYFILVIYLFQILSFKLCKTLKSNPQIRKIKRITLFVLYHQLVSLLQILLHYNAGFI